MMRFRNFSGGIYPAEYKELACRSPIRRAALPESLVVPLVQHVGAPCFPLVAAGDKIRRGQRIGDSEATISAPVHSPVSGEVAAIGHRILPSGVPSAVIVIIPDRIQDYDEFVAVTVTGSLSEIVRQAGIVGLGGAAFPSSVKLHAGHERPVDTVILNGCECEPYLTCDDRIMRELAARVVAGARIIRDGVGAKRVAIAVEVNKSEAIEALSAHVSDDVELIPFPVKYPQGAEKQLIFSVLGQEVPHGKLPSALGVLVHNVQTAVAIAEAVELGKPLMERVVTVTGRVASPGNLLTLLGTPVQHMLDQAGGTVEPVSRVISGGPMTGTAIVDLDTPVVKGTSAIIALSPADLPPAINSDQPCIRCARCVDVCPIHLLPYAIGIYANKSDWEGVERYVPLSCIECGCCQFVCPTHRPLIQLIQSAKRKLMAKGASA